MAHSGIEVLFQGKNFLRLMGGLWTPVWIAGVSLGFGLLFGTFLGVLRTLKNAVLRIVLRLYLEFFRIVPTIVLLFLVYYILPRRFHVEVSAEWMAVLAFSLWVSAEFSDIVRGALESVPKHQREAGLALGLTKGQLFVHVLMPQAFMLELPAAINLATRVVNVGQQIIEANNQQYPSGVFWICGFIFMLYFIVDYPLSLISKMLQQKFSANL